MPHVLGIDLGTTNSVVCVSDTYGVRVLSDREGNPLIPSVVSFHPAGDVLVGHGARERRLLDAKNTIYSVKRLIGRPYGSPEVRRAEERFPFEIAEGPTQSVLVRARGESYTLPEVSAFVLREVRSVAEAALGEPCSHAVITVPANFNELQRSATKAAGRVAGLEVLRILNEPTAAALAYGYGRGSRERIAIFDLGGGTFDITLLELAGDVFEVLATAGDTFLGGDDIDLLIAEQMAEAFLQHHRFDPRDDPQAFERLRAAAEWAKCQLSEQEEVQLRVEELAYGEGGASLDLTFGMTRDALESMVRPLLIRAMEVCEEAMSVAGVRPTQLDNVILVGGSTRMPLVHRMVEEYFDRPPLGHIDPDLVVAWGAALQGEALAPQAQPVAKVKLQKVTRADLEAQVLRREELAKETAEQRPVQPAFAPSRPPEPPSDFDQIPTRVGPTAQLVDDEMAEQPTRVSEVPSAPPPPAAPRRPPPVPVGQPTGRASSRPPPPPPPPAPPVGARTLGFGSGGLPVPDFGAPPASPPASPPALPPSPPSAPAAAGPAAGWSGAAAPPAAPKAKPLLLDVTPLTLGVETVGGYCEPVIARNAAIPVEQSKVFSTGVDGQRTVSVRICQGESRRISENQELGRVELEGLRDAARGEVKVAVTFVMDASGTLDVKALDLETGQEQRVRIDLVGGMSEEEILRMAARHDRATGGGG